MCTSPLSIRSNSVYRNNIFFNSYNTVPCGVCEDCRSSQASKWEFRLREEIRYTYANGGCCIFLTLTYDDSHLPKLAYFDVDKNEVIHTCQCCFSRSDLKTFLNRIKVKFNKKFGKNCYKYFLVSEYGSTTKRSHYHLLLFLNYGNDSDTILSAYNIVLNSWHFGFIFPKLNKSCTWFVDNFGRPCSPELNNKDASASYISKYVCKDLSFYDLPLVKYVSSHCYNSIVFKFGKSSPYALSLLDKLPKHYQSNNLGFSRFFEMSDDEKLSVLKNGVTVFSGSTAKNIPCPSFVRNRFMYKNVISDRKSSVKKSDGSYKFLYDRDLSEFGSFFFYEINRFRVDAFSSRAKSFFLNDYNSFLIEFEITYDIDFSCVDFEKFSVFYLFSRNFSKFVLSDIVNRSGVIDDIFDFDNVILYQYLKSDLDYLKSIDSDDFPFVDVVDFSCDFDYNLYSFLSSVFDTFEIYSRYKTSFDNKTRLEKRKYIQSFINKFNNYV